MQSVAGSDSHVRMASEAVGTPHAAQKDLLGFAIPENNPLSEYTQQVDAHNNIYVQSNRQSDTNTLDEAGDVASGAYSNVTSPRVGTVKNLA